MTSAWTCPHDLNGVCQRVSGAVCDPGMRGCELEGKVRFARASQNMPRKPVKAVPEAPKPASSRKSVPAPRRRLPF